MAASVFKCKTLLSFVPPNRNIAFILSKAAVKYETIQSTIHVIIFLIELKIFVVHSFTHSQTQRIFSHNQTTASETLVFIHSQIAFIVEDKTSIAFFIAAITRKAVSLILFQTLKNVA